MTTHSRKFQHQDIVVVNDEEYENKIGILYNIDEPLGQEPVFTVVFFLPDDEYGGIDTKFVNFTIYSLSFYEEPVLLVRKLKIGDTFYLKKHFNCFYTTRELEFQGEAVTLKWISTDDNPCATLYKDTSGYDWKLINIDIPRTNRGLVNKDVQTKLSPTLPIL